MEIPENQPVQESTNEILKNNEVDRHILFRDVATELNVHHKTGLNR